MVITSRIFCVVARLIGYNLMNLVKWSIMVIIYLYRLLPSLRGNGPHISRNNLSNFCSDDIGTVSYTHLDVYKRQAYNILSNIIFSRLLPYAEENIKEYQCGFTWNRSTTDEIFTLRQILEKTLEYGVATHHLFVDFQSAYDSINRKMLYRAVKELNIPSKLVLSLIHI